MALVSAIQSISLLLVPCFDYDERLLSVQSSSALGVGTRAVKTAK